MSKESDITNREVLSKETSKALATIEVGKTITLSELPDLPEIQMILKAYPEEIRDDIELTREQVELLLTNAKVSTFGVNRTLPLVCRAAECQFASICIFQKMGIAPEGERCPDEILYLDAMVPRLVQDMGVDLENYLEISMVQEYAAALLDERRARNMIAIEGDVKEVATGIVQATGTVLYADQMTPYVEIKEKASKKLSQLRKELLATREQRAKYKLTDDRDPSTRASEMREKFELLKEREEKDKLVQEKNLDEAFKGDIENGDD
jgi:hypothetical protein